MRGKIAHGDEAEEFWFQEGCHILELSGPREGDSDLSIARARVAPGTTTRWHRLAGTTERYVILAGAGEVEIGDGPPQPVGPNDVVVIPPGCAQRISNTGRGDLVFLALCTPPFAATAYEDVDCGRGPGRR